jgi:TRAP-type C4-dicarboxylate transport system substrate-binding protein
MPKKKTSALFGTAIALLVGILSLLVFRSFSWSQTAKPAPAGTKPSSAGPEYVIKLSSMAPAGTIWADFSLKFKKYVEDKSGGRIKIVWSLDSVLGDEPDAFIKIRTGQIQGGSFTNIGLGIMVPETAIISLPFLIRDNGEADYVLEKLTPQFKGFFEERGFILAGWMDIGFNYFFSGKPIKSLRDFKDGRIWAWKWDPVMTEYFQARNFPTLPVGLNDVLKYLEAGKADAFYCPYDAAVARKWSRYAKYVIDPPFYYPPSALVLDKKFFEALPPDLKKIIAEAVAFHIPEYKKLSRQSNQQAYLSLISSGIQPVKLSENEIRSIRKEAEPLYQKFGNKLYPTWLLTRIQGVLEEYRGKKQ